MENRNVEFVWDELEEEELEEKCGTSMEQVRTGLRRELSKVLPTRGLPRLPTACVGFVQLLSFHVGKAFSEEPATSPAVGVPLCSGWGGEPEDSASAGGH